jgi:phage shock protein A
MGILSRMSTVVKAKMSRIVDNAENPNETLDYSYEKQLEMLRDVKRGVVQMVTAKRRIQQQATVVESNMAKLDSQARQAMEAGREDLARLALQRKQASIIELQGLDEQISQMEMEQEKLTVAEQRLTSKVAAFRTKKETIKAQYNAAQAQVRIGEALSGMSEEMGDLSLAMERAENKTQHMRARAGAIDELSTIGMLDDFTGTREDDISRELAQLTSSQSVEEELAAMRPGLPAADRKQLPESGS